MAHIVIIGAGIGGMPAAYEIRELLSKDHKITVVNSVDYFQFVPSNPWIAVGWRQREDITLPIAPYLTRKGIGFIPKGVEKIDAQANQLTLATTYGITPVAAALMLAGLAVIPPGVQHWKRAEA